MVGVLQGNAATEFSLADECWQQRS